jgi:hypothetical protein
VGAPAEAAVEEGVESSGAGEDGSIFNLGDSAPEGEEERGGKRETGEGEKERAGGGEKRESG